MQDFYFRYSRGKSRSTQATIFFQTLHFRFSSSHVNGLKPQLLTELSSVFGTSLSREVLSAVTGHVFANSAQLHAC